MFYSVLYVNSDTSAEILHDIHTVQYMFTNHLPGVAPAADFALVFPEDTIFNDKMTWHRRSDFSIFVVIIRARDSFILVTKAEIV